MRILFSAAYSVIEPLGLMHLAGLARDMGWDRKISLSNRHNFTRVKGDIEEFKPDFVGFNIYTGNHLQTFNFIKHVKQVWPDIKVIVGGPHPTYFPVMASKHVDYVVMSEGFYSLRSILSGKAKPGILPYIMWEEFPLPDREILYGDYPEFAASKIKSMIGMTGCPYQCTYCFNSSSPEDIKIPDDLTREVVKGSGMSGRLFPHNSRKVSSLVKEGQEVVGRWPTEVIAFVDDIHGYNTNWLVDLVDKWPNQVGLPYSSQMRWEMAHDDGGKRRLDLIRAAGGFSLTLAIESANKHIRKEVLHRNTSTLTILDSMQNIRERGFRVRTEQMLGLPYGATTEQTPINLEADLELVELNVKLKPDIAWASTYVPYVGTKLASYAIKHGHYNGPLNSDVPDSFFERSVLRFPKEWVGPTLKKGYHDCWLDDDELDLYRDQNAALRRNFTLLCQIPQGHILARQFLTGSDLSAGDLNGRIKHHLYDEVLYKP